MRRSGIRIMAELIVLITPLLGWMISAIVLGVLGYLAAIVITPLGLQGLLNLADLDSFISFKAAASLMLVCAGLRGILRYGEQACNHTIAFRLLAVIRHKVFVKLRTLAPAKLEGKDKGDLVSMITSDIELLEVFYAHTISPIAIAIITCALLVVFEASVHPILGILALISYAAAGIALPLYFSKKGKASGMQVRTKTAELNSFFLDTLRGIRELMQFDKSHQRLNEFMEQCSKLEEEHLNLKRLEGENKGITDAVVMCFSVMALIISMILVYQGIISFSEGITAAVVMFGSFGPTVALSSLSNNLHHTLAAAERVINLLEEKPQLDEISGKETVGFGDVKAEDITFCYDKDIILKDFSIDVPVGKITGILGKSGSGKSTLIRLMMRFYKVNKGRITINQTSLEEINTVNLKQMESYVTQDTILFNDTLFENIALAKQGATIDEVKEAARKASIDQWIESFPDGYNTLAGELGESLSGGEKQRIGLARAFLHDSDFFLLDEPTSNLDSLNEAVILRSLKEEAKRKTVLIVSHRPSTLGVADQIVKMESDRKS